MTDATPCRILVLNANTSGDMTEALAARARAVARPGTEVVAATPRWGPAAVEGWHDAYLSAAAMLETMAAWTDPLDGVVVAGFGDVGRDGLREMLDVPVVDITEAAVMAAQYIGQRYGIVTTVERARPLIEASLAAAGQLGRCASIRALGVGVSAVAGGIEEVERRFAAESAAAVSEGAEVICLGSGALAPFADRLAAAVEVPVVDGLAAAVACSEMLHQLRLRTSTIGGWAGAASRGRPGRPGSSQTDS